MRFFTPDLYVRFNSSDDEVADRANEEWEAALAGYRKHLDDIRGRLPVQVRRLSELCLHDADVLGISEHAEPIRPAHWGAVAVLTLLQDGELVSLIYTLWDRIREYPMPGGWPFSKNSPHWLYDEVDMAPDDRAGLFLHRVLLSDGRVLELPFQSAIRSGSPLPLVSRVVE